MIKGRDIVIMDNGATEREVARRIAFDAILIGSLVDSIEAQTCFKMEKSVYEQSKQVWVKQLKGIISKLVKTQAKAKDIELEKVEDENIVRAIESLDKFIGKARKLVQKLEVKDL